MNGESRLERAGRHKADLVFAELDDQAISVVLDGFAEQLGVCRAQFDRRGMYDDRLDQALRAVGMGLPFGSENQIAREMLAGEPSDRLGRDLRETRIDKASLPDTLGQMDWARKGARRLDVITKRAKFGIERKAVGRSEGESDGTFLSGKKSASPPEGRCR